MASSFDNNLRLAEMATGDQPGTWGTQTNTNLSLITDAFKYGSEAIANASTATITMQNATADDARSFYLKCTGADKPVT